MADLGKDEMLRSNTELPADSDLEHEAQEQMAAGKDSNFRPERFCRQVLSLLCLAPYMFILSE